MLKMFVLPLLLGPFFSFAQSRVAMNLSCVTSPAPTTSYFMREQQQDVWVHVYHHNDLDYMPIHEGVIVPRDLVRLAERVGPLRDLGDSLSFRFPLSKCGDKGPMILQCTDFKAEPQDINGHRVAALSFHTSRSTETSFAGTYEYLSTQLYLEIDGKSFSLPMKYSWNDCSTLKRGLPAPRSIGR
ncbi:MAG: hypothetical protein KF802_00105 [Bdellovibrionaceae bacterium]|nr:hypothetical protein [Pseudobdellovibrionaceae bacterium]